MIGEMAAGWEDKEGAITKASERQVQYRGNGGVFGVREEDLTERTGGENERRGGRGGYLFS